MSNILVNERVTLLASAPREHAGQRVVLLADVDRLHDRKPGAARDTFRRCKARLTEGKHFFRLDRTTVGLNHGGRGAAGEKVVALTEAGYLLLTKPMNDDVSWAVQERLVEVYFRGQALASQIPADLVLVSRSKLREMADAAASVARLAREATSDSARQLGAWRRLGPSVRAMAREPKEQVYIDTVERLDVVADLLAGASPEARERRIAQLFAALLTSAGSVT